MTSLLSQFASLAAQVETNTVKAEPASSDARQRSGKTRSAKAQERYAKVFTGGNTVAKASGLMNIEHVACLNQVYRYEKRGLMYREGRDTDTGGIIFFWKVGNT